MPFIAIWLSMLLVGGALSAEYQSSKDYERAHPAQYGQTKRTGGRP